MKFSPGFWGNLLGGGSDWELLTEKHASSHDDVVLKTSGQLRKVTILSITSASISTGLIWASFSISTRDNIYTISGVTNEVATSMKSHVEDLVKKRIASSIEKDTGGAELVIKKVDELFNIDRYLSNRDIRRFMEDLGGVGRLLGHPLFDPSYLSPGTKALVKHLLEILKPHSEPVRKRNQGYLNQELQKMSSFFDNVESRPMTDEQRRAAITFEDRNLVIASAGSGKTSVIVAQTAYAIQRGIYKPDEILVLAFNSSAQKELKERIDRKLQLDGKDGPNIKTFHALGLEIITAAKDCKQMLDNVATEGDDALKDLIVKILMHNIDKDPTFRKNWLIMSTVYPDHIKRPSDFKSKNDEFNYIRKFREKGSNGWGIKTFSPVMVKSLQERAIANWLTLEGIVFEYEKPYGHNTANAQYRQYMPDFYYPGINTYHEHFAVDENNKAPEWMGGNKYVEGMKWKCGTHLKHKSDLIVTTSAQFSNGTWMDILDLELTKRRVQRNPLSIEEQKKIALQMLKDQPNLINLICTFIKLAKSVEASPEILTEKAKGYPDARTATFLKIIIPIMNDYQKYLDERNSLDFEDLINDARLHVALKQYIHRYKLIVVDEFQDISQGRARLIKSLLDQNPDTKMTAVGDDWQSIYRFAGADIDIMTDFPSYFGVTEKMFLSKTFRCHKGIAETGTIFVTANKKQIAKHVESDNNSDKKTVWVLSAEKMPGMNALVEENLGKINDVALKNNASLTVFLLGRFNRSLDDSTLRTWRKKFTKISIDFKTIHSSKGLEADYVFVLGVVIDRYGFPCDFSDDPILHMVIPKPEEFSHAEERRLFYVALTRARRCVFLVTANSSQSEFITELRNMSYTQYVKIEPLLPIPAKPTKRTDVKATDVPL